MKLGGPDGSLRDVFFLRADEDPGRGFNNRISKHAFWRRCTDSVPRGAHVTKEMVFQWCEEMELQLAAAGKLA
jgi:hypothetical protein